MSRDLTPAAWPHLLLPASPAADPADLDAAVKAGAFAGLRRALELGPDATLALVAEARLRGRGGGGYPTAEKWRACAATPAAARAIVANGYGADPAAGTDRTLVETNPYAVLEGVAIAALTVGATEAWIALRASDELAVRTLEAAIGHATDAGFLGHDLLGSSRSLEVRVAPLSGASMIGEETVLLKALEGRRGQPEQRPPYPQVDGLFGRPTVVGNVATFATVPWIVVNGATAFAAIGSTATPGTALVAVRGPKGEGIAEVPFGTTLRAIVDLVGGAGPGHHLKAVLVGGPAGGILPAELLDTPYDFESLRAAGAHVGSGGIVAVDERACVVDLARILTRYCADEACGKTIPCRIGLRRLSEIGERIVTGLPKPTDLQLLADLSHDIVESALCDHERLATLPLASGMRYFRAELDEHILRSACPAGVCHPIAVPAGAGA
jgi:NADH:ubiquinone oxidoreductase subunit F (NADH-binding)